MSPHAYTQSTLVTATARLSRQLRREYDRAKRAEGLRVWESPDILPRDAWIERMWQDCVYRDPQRTPVLLSPLQERTLWEDAIAQSDADDILLDRPATAATAARAWKLLHEWEAAIDPAEFAGLRDAEEFLEWHQFVERRLREQDWITAAQLPRALLAQVSGIALPRGVAYTGFDDLAPADQRLLNACGAEMWMPPAIPETRASRVAFDNIAGEITQAAWWARRRLEAAPGASVGVIVPGLDARSAVVERIFDDVLHPGLDFARQENGRAFHVAAGAASSDMPMIAAALGLLRLQSGMPLSEALMLLRSPFLGLDRMAAGALTSELRREGVDPVSLREGAVRRVFPAFAKAAEELRSRQHPGEWSAHFSKLLSLAGWPGPRPLSSEENRALEQWKKLLSHLASLDVMLPRITYADALSRLRRIARDHRLAPNDEDAPVQIMDPREAAGLRFDALWIAGMNANAWPEAPRPNPFLPGSLQRAADLPHSSPERELSHARKVTARLLASAPEVVCSFARHEGEEALRVSPLIAELPEMPGATVPPAGVAQRIFSMGGALEEHPRQTAPPVATGAVQRGGMSILKDQAACPFRAFAVHRLGAKEADTADLGISPTERGSVAHKALELFWRDVQSQKNLMELPSEETSALMERCVNAALDSRLSRRQRSKSLDRARALELERWKKLLLEWLDEEKRQPSFVVVERETPRKVDVGGLTIEIRADRLDRFEDGTYAILDYKTSDNVNVRDWDGERPDAPQLPLYAAKSEHDMSAVHFAQLVPGSAELIGYKGADLASRLPEWKRMVDQLGAAFLRGEAEVDPKYPGKTCEFCDLPALCRVAEQTGADAGEDNGE